jgi:hypothetical protein
LDVHIEETAAFEKAAASDPAAQDAYANVYDVFIAPGKFRAAPPISSATAAVKDLMAVLHGESQGVSGGYKDPKHNPFVCVHLEGMHIFLNFYIDPWSKTCGHWGASALQAAVGLGKGTHCMCALCKLATHDRALLLVNPYGDWKESMLADEDLAADINLYLQEIGKDITAEKLVLYLGRPDMMEKHGITKSITVRMARWYLNLLGYRYMMPQKGQYCDGHKQPDVICARDKVYIPAMKKLEARMHCYSRDGLPEYGSHLRGKQVITWHHNECLLCSQPKAQELV